MRAGRLRHRLRYEEPLEAADSFGQLQPSWSTVAAIVWGDVRTPTGSETFAAQKFAAKVDHVIDLRYPPFPVKAVGRFVDIDAQAGTSGTYNVVAAVDEEGRRRSLKVFAIEVEGVSSDNSNL